MDSSREPRSSAHMLLSAVIGIVLVVLLVAGLNFFYAPPSQSQAKLANLNGQQKALETSRRVSGTMSGSHEKYYKKLTDDIAAQKQIVQTGLASHALNMSIILIVLAALLMGASLALIGQPPIVSDTLLVSGFAMMAYAAVSSFAGGSNAAGWVAVAFVIIAILSVGYVLIVGSRRASVDAAPKPPSVEA